MHPCRTALIGLLLFGLTNAQHPAGFLNTHLYAQGDIPDYQGEQPYWWMNKGSPFKRSYSAGDQPSGYSNNAFLGGNSISNDAQYAASNQQIDVSNNPFLSGKPFAAASSNSYNNAAEASGAYAAPGYLPPDQTVRTISCTERGQVCVTKYLCRNGYVDSALTEGSKQVSFFFFFLVLS